MRESVSGLSEARRLPAGIFVCGTDTGVGKTTVAALLLASMRAAGINAAPMKPVETGCRRRHGAARAADLELCLGAAGLRPDARTRQWMAPYRFTLPASPHLAARLEKKRIDSGVIRRAFERLSARYRPVLVEGAGGVMVPLRGRFMLVDLAVMLDLPVVLVARAGLGTINHTLLTLEALAQRRLRVAGVVFNDGPGDHPLVARDNLRCIPRLSGVPCLGRIPFRRGMDAVARETAGETVPLTARFPGGPLLMRKVLEHAA